jgi:hypothetical protein
VYARGVRGSPALARLVDGTWQVLYGGGIDPTVWVDVGPLGEGDHTFRASIPDSDYVIGSSRELTIHVAKGATTPQWLGALTVQAHHALPGQVSLSYPDGTVPIVGQMTVQRADGAFTADGDIGFEFSIPAMSVGTHDFLVSYAGSESYAASQAIFAVTVTPDIVEATGVGLDASKFFPVRDGYRDVVRARGNRAEPLAVSVAIYDGANRLVRRLSSPRAAGAYAVAWNGRNTAGALQAAGTYRVVQTLTDAFGTTRSFTHDVALSRKKLYTYTKYLAKPTPTKRTKSWGAWQFSLPTATVYEALVFQVYGRSVNVPGMTMGGWDTRRCAWSATWSPDCVASWASVGASTAWHSKKLSTVYGRHGSSVRAFVAAQGSGVVYKARLKVTYGVLK